MAWLSLLRTARAPLAVVILAGLALVVPTQARDMLAALGDDAMPVLWFYLALAALTFSGWYWARALISARFDVPMTEQGQAALAKADQRLDLFAFEAVPWLIFVLAALVGLALIVVGGAGLGQAGWFLLWVVVAILFRPGRRQAALRRLRPLAGRAQEPYRAIGRGHPQRSTNRLSEWWRALPIHLRLLTHRAPGGPLVAWGLIALALAVFVWSAVVSFATARVLGDAALRSVPVLLAELFPGPGAALICLALMIAPLSVITFLADGFRIELTIAGRSTGPRRPPVILALALVVIVMPFLFHLHTVRTAPGELPPRQDLGQYFARWAAACAPGDGPVRPIIVALSGGASRAAVWGAEVLQAVERATVPGGAAVFAVSSVSGGSLGAAAYFSLLAGLPDGERCAPESHASRQQRVELLASAPLGKDVLAAVLAGWLANDIPRALLTPFAAIARMVAGGAQPRGGDRAEALERAFERLWQRDWPSPGTKRQPFDAPFLSLFYDNGQLRQGMPLWIANGTDLNSGSRLLTLPVAKHPWPFAAARDVLSLVNADVPISTAINNTARFPWLEPSGELLRAKAKDEAERSSWHDRLCDQMRVCDLGPTEIIDGGYFENGGLQSALDLADWLEKEGAARLQREVRPIIVQATADGVANISPASIVRWQGPEDDPAEVPRAPASVQLWVPFFGLMNARGGHSAVLLRTARDRYGCDFFHFMLPGEDGRDVPLNWVLSQDTTAAIRKAMAKEPPTINTGELERLRTRLAGKPADCP